MFHHSFGKGYITGEIHATRDKEMKAEHARNACKMLGYIADQETRDWFMLGYGYGFSHQKRKMLENAVVLVQQYYCQENMDPKEVDSTYAAVTLTKLIDISVWSDQMGNAFHCAWKEQ